MSTDRGELFPQFVISAVGFLSMPRYPDWPGLDEFAGPVFHTSRWRDDVDLHDKRVGLVGTGSTAVQLVSELAKVARGVALFQREPGWVTRKGAREFTPEERARLSTPRGYRLERLRAFARVESTRFGGGVPREGSKADLRSRAATVAYMRAELGDREDLVEALTPKYGFGGKRRIRDDNYYATLAQEHVELVPYAVERVDRTGVTDVRGVHHELDALVLATGFRAAEYLCQFELIGRDGRSIREFWGEEPAAFVGVTVPGYPNFFMIYGPNTNSALILLSLELEAQYAVDSIRRTLRKGATAVETKESWYRRYNDWLQRVLRKTVWASSNNYFKSSTGRVVTQWPYGRALYWLLLKALRRPSSRYERVGSGWRPGAGRFRP